MCCGALIEQGELFSTSLVLLSADAEGENYQIISHWASKEAHDRHEDNPQDLAAQRAATPFLVTPRSYSEVRNQRLERVIRQVSIYGVLTGTLLLLYLSGIFVLQTVLQAFIGQTSGLVIVASTLAVVLFQPLRQRIQEVIDHRFYRDRYNARRTLEELELAVRQEIDLTQLSEHILTLVNKTLHPTTASLWLFPLQQVNDNRTAPSRSDQIRVFGAQIISPLSSRSTPRMP